MTLAFRKSSHRFLFIDVFIKAMGFIELKSVLCIAIVGENLSPIYILSIGIATYNMNGCGAKKRAPASNEQNEEAIA